MSVIIVQKGFFKGNYSVVFVRGDGVDSNLQDFDNIPDAVKYAKEQADNRKIKAITNKVFPYSADLSKVK